MLRNGEVEMQARDEEIRFLRMQLAEEQRVVSLMKRSLPSKKATEEEIVTLQIEVIQLSRVAGFVFVWRHKANKKLGRRSEPLCPSNNTKRYVLYM